MILTTIDPVLAPHAISSPISTRPDGLPDPATIEALLPKMREVFGVLDDTLAARPYLAGEEFTLADMFLFPLIWFMRLKPESAALLQASPHSGTGSTGSPPGRARARNRAAP